MDFNWKELERNYQSNQSRDQAAPKKQDNALLSALPSALAAAASFIPGVGTIAGGLIGGAGEAGRQLISGEKFDAGKVAGEAALSAIPFGIGKAGKIIGAGKKAVGIGGKAKAMTQAAKPGEFDFMKSSGTQGANSAQATLINQVLSQSRNQGSLGKLGIGGFQQGQQQAANIGSNILKVAGNQQLKTANLGRNIIGLGQKSERASTIAKAADAERFNSLAKQNIDRLAWERATQGIPLGKDGGVLVKSGEAPSFITEGVEYQNVPKIPNIDARYTKPAKTVLAGLKTTGSRTGKNSASSVEEVTKDVALPEAPATVEQPSLIDKFSRSATRSGSGLKVGRNVGDSGRLDEAVELFQRRKISGSPDKQLKRIDEEMATAGREVDEILSRSPIKLDGAQVRAQVQSAIDDPLKYADVDLTVGNAQKYLEGHLTKFAGAPEAKGLNDYIKTLNPVAKRAQDKIARGIAPTDKEVAALVAKRAGDDVLKQIPEIAPLKKDMAIMFERNPDVAKLAEQKTSATILGTTIPSRAIKQGLAGAQSAIGQATSGQAGAQGSSLFNKIKGGAKFAGELAKQGATRSIAGPILNPSEEPDPTELTDASLLPETPIMNTDTGDSGAISQGQLMAAIAADPKNADTYITLYKLFNEGQGAKKPMSAESAKTLSNAQTGLSALDQIEGQLTADPNIQQRGGISGTFNPFGVVSGVLGTGEYENARAQARDIIARIRTGAALTNDEAKAFDKFLPQPGDSQSTVQQKLGTLRSQFQYIVDNAGGAGTDLQGAL